MNLEIVSPEKIIYSGNAESVTLPGLCGSFTILNRHAPIISALDKGRLTYTANGQGNELSVAGGFVEAKKNTVSVCVETV
jgi:F-type H+-transporting ATPase subunit epsilon